MPRRVNQNKGRILAGTYRLLRRLAHGAMGEVYAAEHLRTGGKVAVKLLLRTVTEDDEMYKRFQEEARIGSVLKHPHIVDVTDFDHDEDDAPFMVMELLSGETLDERIRSQGTLSILEVEELIYQVGSALHAAHTHERRVVHRDVKPQNIFLVRHDMSNTAHEMAKILDFGIAKIQAATIRSRTGQVIGTPNYMSPEAAESRHDEIDGRADQFSLAVVAYRALSGVLPFTGASVPAVLHNIVHAVPRPLHEVAPNVSLSLSAAIHRALSKDPADRFSDMATFVAAVTEACAAMPPPQPRRPLIWFVSLLMAVGVLAFVLTIWLVQRIDPEREPVVPLERKPQPALMDLAGPDMAQPDLSPGPARRPRDNTRPKKPTYILP